MCTDSEIPQLECRNQWAKIVLSEFCCVGSIEWPRAPIGKAFWRLSLVTCPVALYPATSDSEKISFNQINRNTSHRTKYLKVDADTGEEVPSEDIIKGYKVDTDTYVEVSKDELENVALESTRTDIYEFVPKSDIDELSPKVGDGGNREGGISWGCLTPPLLHRRSDMPCPTITSSI